MLQRMLQHRLHGLDELTGRTLSDSEAVCYLVGMSWFLPTPLLLFAGVVALWPLAVVVRRPI
jgi:hypothetical protein